MLRIEVCTGMTRTMMSRIDGNRDAMRRIAEMGTVFFPFYPIELRVRMSNKTHRRISHEVSTRVHFLRNRINNWNVQSPRTIRR